MWYALTSHMVHTKYYHVVYQHPWHNAGISTNKDYMGTCVPSVPYLLGELYFNHVWSVGKPRHRFASSNETGYRAIKPSTSGGRMTQ